MSLRAALYRGTFRAIFRKGPIGAVREKRSGVKRVWIHAASAGELEILWPIALLLKNRPEIEFVLTVFSPSGEGRIKKLAGELGERVLFQGFSPWEGAWRESLARARPDLFVTAKYEAWPELWAALGELGIPLAIVGARARKSLSVCRRVCALLGAGLPELLLFPVTEEERAPLAELFPKARIECLGEPRWDQVQSRRAAGNARARELIERFARLPKPWGIFGSAWLEDLNVFEGVLAAHPGTLWIVPHRVDADYISSIEKFLSERGLAYAKTSEGKGEAGIILVDEIGFLLELYSAADWAYVGGGFGKGVHSTIEPALSGIPVGAGPKGAEKFPEIGILSRSGQLTLIRSASEAKTWVAKANGSKREQWLREAQGRLGASARIEATLLKKLGLVLP